MFEIPAEVPSGALNRNLYGVLFVNVVRFPSEKLPGVSLYNPPVVPSGNCRRNPRLDSCKNFLFPIEIPRRYP